MSVARLFPCHRLYAACLLACVLVLAQGVVRWHAVAHAHGTAAVAGAAEADGPWSHPAGVGVCQLLDQGLVGQAVGVVPPLGVPALFGSAEPQQICPADPAARPAGHFLARAPPAA